MYAGGADNLVYPQQKDYLHKLLQSRLFTDHSPLMDLYDTLRILSCHMMSHVILSLRY